MTELSAVSTAPKRESLARDLAPLVIGLVALALFFYLFSSILTPFAMGIALGYLLDPIAGKLQRLGLNRLGAALLILAVFLVILIVGFAVIVPVLGHQLANFVDALPKILAKAQQLMADSSSRLFDSWLGELMQKYGLAPKGESSGDAQKWASEIVANGVGWAATLFKSLLSGGAALFGIVSLLVVTPVVAFYILVDWDKMVSAVQSLVPPRYRMEAGVLARDIDRALAGFLRGQSLVCLFLGLWYGIGLSLIGLNFGFLIGITAGVLSFIPYVGSLTALIVASIVALVQGWPSLQLFLMALGVVGAGQFLEGNFLSPKLVGGSVGLHPVWLMFALLAGGALFGFAGLIVAVPVAAALGVLLRFAFRRYRQTPFYLGREQNAALISAAVISAKAQKEP